jgi:hypothetical protein
MAPSTIEGSDKTSMRILVISNNPSDKNEHASRTNRCGICVACNPSQNTSTAANSRTPGAGHSFASRCCTEERRRADHAARPKTSNRSHYLGLDQSRTGHRLCVQCARQTGLTSQGRFHEHPITLAVNRVMLWAPQSRPRASRLRTSLMHHSRHRERTRTSDQQS